MLTRFRSPEPRTGAARTTPTTTASMPGAHPAHRARVGALDGLRALAVLAVVVYHLSPRTLPGGYLGVDVFMVLSGFLVTGLLVRELDRSGRVRLGAFLGRRFRRLVPAMLLLVAIVAVWVAAVGDTAQGATVRRHGVAALAYVTNWRLIADGTTYGGATATESPVVHLWSLAVEEQFYLAWPPLLLGLVALTHGRRGLAALGAAAAAVVSAVAMIVQYQPGSDPLRLYYGTDTRAQAFLAGAAAALAIAAGVPRARHVAAVLALPAAAVVGALMYLDPETFLYRGGFTLVAVATAAVAVAATARGPVAVLLDRAPLRALGRVSYGVYLWHWPAIVLLTEERTGLHGLTLAATQLSVTAAGTLASWFLVERPIARAQPRTVVVGGAAAVAVAAVALVALPARGVVPFADHDLARRPVPEVEPARPAPAPPTTDHGPLEVAASRAAATRAEDVAPPPLALPEHGTAMIVGDSGMYSASPALRAALHAAGWATVDTSYPGMGLTTSGAIGDWAETVRNHAVDLTVVMVGGWDVGFVERHGADAYRAVLQAATEAFTAAGGKVLWLSEMPGGTHDTRRLEHLFAELPGRHPAAVHYVDVGPALHAPGGGWPQVVEGRRLRGPDGWHLCPDGAVALVRHALGAVGLDRAAWDSGPWRADTGYDDPPGACRST